VRLWKAQDQEGNKYSSPSMAAEGRASGVPLSSTGMEVKEEATEWRESLREHFREPMHCEMRERIVKVNCKIRFLPDNTFEATDLTNLLQLASPRHVVLLPSRGNSSTGDMLKAYFEFSKQSELNRPPPEVHILRPKDFPLQLSLRSSKRKLQISNDMWPQISYMKSLDGIRIARLRGSADVAKPELGPLDIDLEETAPPKLPKEGALFLGMGPDALHLSALKESLLGAEWSSDVDMAFRPPSGQRPWSSRILSLGKAAVGFKNAPGPGAAAPLRLEGMPSEEFFLARAALYKRCAVV